MGESGLSVTDDVAVGTCRSSSAVVMFQNSAEPLAAADPTRGERKDRRLVRDTVDVGQRDVADTPMGHSVL